MAKAGRLHGFSHLPGPGPASSKTRGPLVHIAGRSKACPSCQPAYGPLTMPDPRPGRTPPKPAPPTLARCVRQVPYGSDSEALWSEDPMDQGLSALIAGIAGMVGALGGAVAGGIAAVRGARIGAEKALDAVKIQVREQADAEHRHWVRQQRHQTCSLILQKMTQLFDSLSDVSIEIQQGQFSLPSDKLTEAGETAKELLYEARSLLFWGPESVGIAAMSLASKGASAFTALNSYAESFIDDHNLEANGSAAQESFDELRSAYVSFLSVARDALRNPRVAVMD